MARGLCLLTILAAIMAASVPAQAQQRVLSDDDLAAALDIYAASAVADHRVEMACSNDKDKAEAAWQQGKRLLVGSLWANGLPAEAVRAVAAELDQAPTEGNPRVDCSKPDAAEQANWLTTTGWSAAHLRTLRNLGLTPVENPATDEQWTAIKAVFDTELPLQARLFECIAVTQGRQFPTVMADWSGMVIEVGKSLIGAGVPRDEVVTLVERAEPDRLWHKAAAAEMDALKASCQADSSWSDRYYRFETRRLAAAVSDILAPKP
jgi:hypothetical protein